DDIPESEQPPRKRLCLFALGSRYEVGESSTARPTGGQGIDYGFVSIVDAKDLYALLEDAQDSRTRISQRVTMDSQRVDLLIEDRIAHQVTILIVEEEAYASREAWAHKIHSKYNNNAYLTQSNPYLQSAVESLQAVETLAVVEYNNPQFL
ncbi:hypothetical protein Tco_0275333, partial [Tanacetum coccineum]